MFDEKKSLFLCYKGTPKYPKNAKKHLEFRFFMKKLPIYFGESKKCSNFANAMGLEPCCEDIGIWCNGNTTDSGPVILGSSPSIPT